MKLQVTWIICSFIFVSAHGMISPDNTRNTAKRAYSEFTYNEYEQNQTTDKFPRYDVQYDGMKQHHMPNAITFQPSSLLRVTKKDGGHYLERPHMMLLCQYKNMQFDKDEGKWTAQCAFCLAEKKCKKYNSLYYLLREHCNTYHYARSTWICLCGQYFQDHFGVNFNKHVKSHTAHNRTKQIITQDPNISLRDGHFVFTSNNQTFYMCNTCGRVCKTHHEFSDHRHVCSWQHTLVNTCDYSNRHENMKLTITRKRNTCWQIELTHITLPPENADFAASMLKQQEDNSWLTKCDRCNFSFKTNQKNMHKLNIHYNEQHTHKYIYICRHCNYTSYTYRNVKEHTKLVHGPAQSFAHTRKPKIYNNDTYCTVIFSKKNKKHHTKRFSIEKHTGGHLGTCSDCMFFAANNKGDIDDIQQALRDHYNQEHDTTHVYICRCGQFFYAKRMLYAHLTHQDLLYNTRDVSTTPQNPLPDHTDRPDNNIASDIHNTDIGDILPTPSQKELEISDINNILQQAETSRPPILDMLLSEECSFNHKGDPKYTDTMQTSLLNLVKYEMCHMMKQPDVELSDETIAIDIDEQ